MELAIESTGRLLSYAGRRGGEAEAMVERHGGGDRDPGDVSDAADNCSTRATGRTL